MWPVLTADDAGVKEFMKDKLRLDDGFLDNELGRIDVTPNKDPRSKVKDEVVVHFETKDIRDIVKSNASNLANHREMAGMRLQLPEKKRQI